MNCPHHAAIERISVFTITSYIRGLKLLDTCLWLDGIFFMLENLSQFGRKIAFVDERGKTIILQEAVTTLSFNTLHSTTVS